MTGEGLCDVNIALSAYTDNNTGDFKKLVQTYWHPQLQCHEVFWDPLRIFKLEIERMFYGEWGCSGRIEKVLSIWSATFLIGAAFQTRRCYE